VDPRKKVTDLNCGVQDLLLEVVDLIIRGAGSEIRRDPPQFNHCTQLLCFFLNFRNK